MSGYACPGCDFAHGKWSALLDHLRATDHDGGGTVCYDEFALAWAAEGEELGIASASPDGAK